MLKVELLETIRNGENSGVEFKRDDIPPQDLAKALVALANFQGGRVLLGVEDDGSVSGVVRADPEEWVLTVCRDKVRPPLVPYVERVRDVDAGRDVVVVTVDEGYAVHARWHNNALTYYLRVGRQSREASTEELGRLQQRRGDVRAELRPAPGASLEMLDRRRLIDYFVRVRGQHVPTTEDQVAWRRLLVSTELAVEVTSGPVATVAGLALFGRDLGRLLPHVAVDAVSYPGTEKGYASRERSTLRAPLTPLLEESGVREDGVVELAVAFVQRHTGTTVALVDGTRRVERPTYPADVLREVLTNAVVHRDYSLTGSDIELAVYTDRLEVISPGRLPNGVTTESIRVGVRAARNQLIKDTMRDYGYIEHMGLGIPLKIVAGMLAHNGREPEFEEVGERFRVRLRA